MFLNQSFAIVLRHVRLFSRDINYFLACVYWPMLDIMTWGFLGTWIQQTEGGAFHNYKVTALLGILLWGIVGRGGIYLISTFVEELWSYNLMNLFSLPLHLGSWMLGAFFYFLLMLCLVSCSGLLMVYALYDLSPWYMLSAGMIFVPPLILSALWLSFVALQFIVTFGKRGTEVCWIILWMFMPFSGAFCPINVLPHWGQVLSSWLPMSYVFQAMRGQVMYGKDPTALLLKGYLLGALYAVLAIVGFVYAFNRSKRKGLARLAD